MRSVDLYLNREGGSKGIAVLKCPVCGGIGSISCLTKEERRGREGEKGNHLNPFCLSLPVRIEERCNCCDGKGWVNKGQSKFDLFCRLSKEEGEK